MFKNRKRKEMVTTHELADIILTQGVVPTPIYTGKNKKRKPIKF